jgi:hypothetical protein
VVLISTRALHQAVCALRTSASVMAWLTTVVAWAAQDRPHTAKVAAIKEKDFMA